MGKKHLYVPSEMETEVTELFEVIPSNGNGNPNQAAETSRAPVINPELTKYNEFVKNFLDNYNSDFEAAFRENGDKLLDPPTGASENILHRIARSRNAKALQFFRSTFDNSESAKLSALLSMKSSKGSKRTPFHVAVENGFVEFVRQFLTEFPERVCDKDGKGLTLLHTAITNSGPDGLECMELILKAAQSTNNVSRILRDNDNDENLTPLHYFCKYLPMNGDAGVERRLQLLLDGYTNLGVWDFDAEKRTSVHFICGLEKEQAGSENAQIVLKELVRRIGDRINETTTDANQTALHLAVINEYPNLVEILLDSEHIDVVVTDKHGKMPIHYAAERAIWSDSQRCFRLLTDWGILKGKMKPIELDQRDLFRRYLVEKTCVIQDKENGGERQHTALSLVALEKSPESVKCLLQNLDKATDGLRENWFKDKEREGRSPKIFSLRPVFKHTPQALEFLFDSSIKIDESGTNERTVKFTTDLSVLSAFIRPIRKDEAASEIESLKYANEWEPETQEKLLLHPLTQCALQAIWRKMWLFKLLWVLMNLVWLILYYLFVPMEFEQSPEVEGKMVLSSKTTFAAYGLLIMLIWSFFCNLPDVYHLVHHILNRRISKVVKIFEMQSEGILQAAITGLVVIRPCTGMHFLDQDKEKFLAAIGVFLAFTLFWRNISFIYLPFGIQVEYLIQTLKKILLAMICSIFIIIGVERAFLQLFPEEFSTGLFSIVRTLVMTTGEFEFTELFENMKDVTYKLTAFIVFLLILPIAFYNLVTGLVVDKIQQMERTLETKQILNQIRLINYIHRSFWSKLFFYTRLECLKSCYVSYKHRDDRGSIEYDPKIVWIVERGIKRSSWSKLLVERLLGLLNNIRNICRNTRKDDRIQCGNQLPERVKNYIFLLDKKST